MDDLSSRLSPQQTEFLKGFADRDDARTLLVAAPGSGKTSVAWAAAIHMLDAGSVDRVLLVGARHVMLEPWSRAGPRQAHLLTGVTYSALSRDPERIWGDVPRETRWLFVFDDVGWVADSLEAVAAAALARFPGSRALFIATDVPPIAVDAQFQFTHEFFGRAALEESSTRFNLARLAPSIGILERVQRKLIQLDDLSWREFERLIAQMLETDGYQVDLMQGSKDGGVDVVAIKDMGDAGLFKSVWQAKKNRLDRKVGLSVVRELADTRLEHGASKAIIVTTSYLTSGALERVERDRYLLGKVDRGDLDRWIDRTLRKK